MEIKNKKAAHNYKFITTDVAGIVLQGCEVKSVRDGKVSLTDAYCYIDTNCEMWLKNSYIAPYDNIGYGREKYDERRNRKLLLKRQELKKYQRIIKVKGYTIIPSKIFIDNNGRCKVVINLSVGKKEYDKRADIKERDIDRQIKREI